MRTERDRVAESEEECKKQPESCEKAILIERTANRIYE